MRGEAAADARAATAACLVTLHGPTPGRRIDLSGDETLLGRDPECDVVLACSEVSRRHARIQRTGGGFLVEDLGSTHGTTLNDERLPPGIPEVLRGGDLLGVAGVVFRSLQGESIESALREEIHRSAVLDGLTQLPNRRQLDEWLERERRRAARHGRPLSLLLLDVDRLGALNARLGEVGGDRVLRELGHLLCGEVRAECWLGRRDGGTFVLVLPETDRTGARVLAERLRTRVEAHAFRCARDVGPVTVSIGLGALDESIDSTPQFYQRAEAHLAEAKRAGRNRVGTGSVEGSAS